eukprot:s2085_g23.t1
MPLRTKAWDGLGLGNILQVQAASFLDCRRILGQPVPHLQPAAAFSPHIGRFSLFHTAGFSPKARNRQPSRSLECRKRASLEECPDSALTAKLMLLQMGSNEKVSDFLLKAPDPPEKLAIENSIQLLVELGALTKGEQLTALGEHLTKSPLPPRLAKTVLWAILLGCLDDALSVVAAAGGFFREPWKTAGMEWEEAKELKRNLAKPHNSDHGCLLNAVTGYTDASNQQSFCDRWQLNQTTMRLIRDQQNRLYTECQENKTDSFANRHRGNFQLLTAVLCAGIFPNIARRRGGSDFYEAQNGKVEARLHGSTAYVPEKPDEWVFFQELSQMESTYRLKLVSPVTPLQMLLLGGQGPLQKEMSPGKGNGKGGVVVSMLDGWVKFRTDESTADQVQKVRSSLQAAFQSFCASPDQIPNTATLQMLDQAVAVLSDASGPSGGAMKRAASWPAEDRGGPAQRTWSGHGRRADFLLSMKKQEEPTNPNADHA